MDVRVYSLGDLEKHLQSIQEAEKQPSPLSPLRLRSYLKNPRARSGDPVLFELHVDQKMVAFRTLLPDTCFDRQGNSHPFAWLSGNWVDPEYRRQGYSTRLLQEVETHWEGRLMYTNYALASKAVYDRTGNFPLLSKREGKRYYLRAAAEDLLGDRLGARRLLRFGDQAVNKLREKRLQEFKGVEEAPCQMEEVPSLKGELGKLVALWQEGSLFRRDADVFRWILEYPWVTEDPGDPLNYPFSYGSRRFENILLRFSLPDQSQGLLWMLLHNQGLSIPYVFADSDLLYSFMAKTMIRHMISRNCAYATIRQEALIKHMVPHQQLFLHVRNMPQLIFAHKTLAEWLPRDPVVQDGDGDVVFTG